MDGRTDETVAKPRIYDTFKDEIELERRAISMRHVSLFKIIYTVNHEKGGSTFVIITLENLDGFHYRAPSMRYSMTKMSVRLSVYQTREL